MILSTLKITMGLVWSDYRKVKSNTMLITKATITSAVNDDVWLLWRTLKDTPKMQQLKNDGFGIGKDNFDGNRWKVNWFYTIKANSFDEVDGVPKWRRKRDALVQKWILQLTAIKAAIADDESDDESNEYLSESSDSDTEEFVERIAPKKVVQVKKAFKNEKYKTKVSTNPKIGKKTFVKESSPKKSTNTKKAKAPVKKTKK